MWENPKLAKRYLYQDQVAKWFREIERPEIALEINEITEDYYPGDRDAGLYATCLVLDQNMPFYGLKGNRVSTEKEIAKELFDNVDEYSKQLSNPTSLLWVYLRTVGLNNKADTCPNIIKDNAVRGIHQLCYELDSDLPYRITLNHKNTLIYDFEQLYDLLHNEIINDNNIEELTNSDFLTWVSSKNSVYAGAATENLQNANKSLSGIGRGWLVAYSLGFNVGYDFLPTSGKSVSKLINIEDLAYQMADEINNISAKSYQLIKSISTANFSDTRLCQYLVTRKKYTKQISWVLYCMDIKSKDNLDKYSPYNLQIAQMKVVAGLLNKTFPLYIAGVTICDLKDYKASKSVIDIEVDKNVDELERLQDWLTLQFQENPHNIYEKKSYFELVKEYLQCLCTNLETSTNARSALNVRADINSAKKIFSNARRGVVIIQWFVGLFCFIPLIAACAFAIYNLYSIDPEVFRSTMEGIGNILGIIIGLIAGCIALAYIYWLIALLIGWGAGALVVYLCSAATPIVPWILIGALGFIMYMFGRTIFARYLSKPEDQWANMDLDQAADLACISAAFNKRNRLLPNLPSDYPECVYTTSAEKIKSNIAPLVKKAIYMLIITFAVCGLFGWVGSSQPSNTSSNVALVIDNIAGDYSGSFGSNKATIHLEKQHDNDTSYLTGTITISYSKPFVQNVVGAIDPDDPNHVILMLKNSDGTLDQGVKYDALFKVQDTGNHIMTGTYTNSNKGSSYKFEFAKNN